MNMALRFGSKDKTNIDLQSDFSPKICEIAKCKMLLDL